MRGRPVSRRLMTVACGVLLLGTSAAAHHSIAAYYDRSKEVTIDAVVTRVQFVNPHPFLWVDVTRADGGTTAWRLEMDNRGELVRAGLAADTLRSGDRVRVRGSVARSQPNELYISRLERPSDGLLYEQVGGSPRVTRRGT